MDIVHELDQTPRRAIASYPSHQEAQALVNRLAEQGFPVERLTIVGRDPEIVEEVTGRLDAGRALLAGALSGALFGVFFGLLFGILFTHDGVSLLAILAYWTLLSALFGAVFSVVGYAFDRPRREFTSLSTIRAASYDVLADEDVADRALQLSRTAAPGGHGDG
jgi:hypothetical protein